MILLQQDYNKLQFNMKILIEIGCFWAGISFEQSIFMFFVANCFEKLQIQVLYHCLLRISIFCCIYCCKNIGVTNNRRTLGKRGY